MESVLSKFYRFSRASQQIIIAPRARQRWIFRSDAGVLGRERRTDTSILWISAALFMFGLATLANSIVNDAQSRSVNWPVTIGTITAVRVLERDSYGKSVWMPELIYRYSVHGHTIESTRLDSSGGLVLRSRADADQFVKRYALHSQVRVYFNPNIVNESMLEPSTGWAAATWIGILFVVSGVAIFVIYDRVW